MPKYGADSDSSVLVASDGTRLSIGTLTDGQALFRSGTQLLSTPVSSPQGVIVVAKSGGDHTTIEAAIAASSAGDAIVVYSDDNTSYSENNPLTMKADTSLVSVGGSERVNVACQNAASNGIVLADGCSIDGIKVSGASGVGSIGFSIPAGVTVVQLESVELVDCAIGIHSAGSGLLLANGVTFSSGTFATLISVGAGSNLGVNAVFSASSVLATKGFVADGAGAKLVAHNSHLAGWAAAGTVAIEAANGGEVTAGLVEIAEGTNTVVQGLHVAATGGTIYATACRIGATTTWDAIIESATGVIEYSGGRIDSTKISRVAGASFRGYYNEAYTNDLGTSIQGELHVGAPEFGAETVLGEGDSTIINQVALTFDGAAAYVDKTSDIADGTAVTLPGVTAGNALMIGNTSRKFPGWKEAISSAVVMGAGSFVVELSDGVGGFTTIGTMTADSNTPYDAHGFELFQRVQSSQVRIDDTIAAYTAWDKDTYGGHNAYWLKIRVATGITTSPTWSTANGTSSIKSHTNRWECNADGLTELFGAARKTLEIPFSIAGLWEAVGLGPKNQDLLYSANVQLKAKNNLFQDANIDGTGGAFRIPKNMDTSFPLTILFEVYPLAVGGDFELEFTSANLRAADPVDGTHAEVLTAEVQTAGTINVPQAFTFTIDISGLLPNDTVAFTMKRDATGANPDDTLAASVAIESITVSGKRYK